MNDAPSPTELTATHSSRGWRMAAVLVAVSIVGLVVATRLDTPAPAPELSPQATDFAVIPSPLASQTPEPTPRATPSPLPRLSIAGDRDRFRDVPAGTRYVDGIPAVIDGVHVHRINEAVESPVGETLMVGGWFVRHDCAERRRRLCRQPTITDTRTDDLRGSGLFTDWLVTDFRLMRSGAYVLSGRLEEDPRCSIFHEGMCQPRLHVVDVVWPI